MGELFVHHPTLGQDPDLKPTHVEQQVGVVLAVHGNEAGLPLDGGDGAGKTVLYLPENSTSSVQKREKEQGRTDSERYIRSYCSRWPAKR